MRIFLTGASGFIGSHFCRNHDVKRIAVRSSSDSSLFDCDRYVVDDINGQTCWSGAFEGIDTVVHLAAIAHRKNDTKENLKKVNIYGTLNLARQAAFSGVKRFVFLSSIGVNGYQTLNKPFSVDSIASPYNDYAKSKYFAEKGLRDISIETGLEVVIVRPTLVYGANAPGSFGKLTKLVDRLPILPFGLANNRRDFIAVHNLIDLLVTCATHPNAAGHTFLASDGETLSITDFTNAIAKGLGKNVIQLPIPVALMRMVGKLTGNLPMIQQLYGNLEVDSSNIKEVLRWTPPFTMEQAMATLRDSGSK